MRPSELHPEPLIERDRHGALDPASRERLDEHLARCAACAMERTLARGFDEEAEPDDVDRERAARVVARMFAGDALEVDLRGLRRGAGEGTNDDTATDSGEPSPRPSPGGRGSTGLTSSGLTRAASASAGSARTGPTNTGSGASEPRPGLPLVASLAASLAVHAVLLAVVLLLASAIDATPEPLDPIEISLVAPESPSPSHTMEPTEALAPIQEAASTRVRDPRRTRPSIAEPTSVTNAAVDAAPDPTVDAPPALEPGLPEESVAARRQRLAILMAPGNVARSGFVIEGQPSRAGAPAGIAPLRDRGPSGAEIGRSLSRGLRGEAMTKAYTAREHPRLRRRPDGSQVYEGPRFAAIIRPDGSVDFQDHGAVQGQGFSASGTFDATELFMQAAGQDPLAAERDWFMRETEELRHGLEVQHRRQEMGSALRTLRGRLTRVWATTDRSTAARRRRIFSIWDDMAEDDTGREARRIVVDFVRETLPVGSDDAYTDAELTRLNASRESRAEFAPY